MSSPQEAATRPPLHEVAHLGHIELLTPSLGQSLWFFTDVLGLTENGPTPASRLPQFCRPETVAWSTPTCRNR